MNEKNEVCKVWQKIKMQFHYGNSLHNKILRSKYFRTYFECINTIIYKFELNYI